MAPNRAAHMLLLAAVLAGPVHADISRIPQEDPVFDKLDADADGFISRPEASKDSRVAERFERLDVNKDDRLDKVEFAALDAIDKQQPKPTR